MRRRFQIVTTTCRRCGKAIATGNRSLWGADEAKAKYDRICSGCVTPTEEYEITRAIGQVIAKEAK